MSMPTVDHRKGTLALVGGFPIVLLLWDTMVVYPIKVFVVLLHEISHGLAAVVTGGTIVKIEVSANKGGVCTSAGGIRFIVASAGYLGSLLWGAAIFLLAALTRWDRVLSGLIGIFIIAMTLLYVRNWFGFGFGLAAGGALIAAIKFPEAVVDYALKLIGLTSCLYAILDIFSDTISRRNIGSDADTLAELTLIPGVVWGAIWIAISVTVSVAVVYVGLFRKRQPRA